MKHPFGLLLVPGVLPKANGVVPRLTQPTRQRNESPASLPFRDMRAISAVHTEAAGNVFPLVVSGGCTADLVLEAVAEECDCLAAPFLKALLGLNEEDDDENLLHEQLDQLCATAWGTVERSTWQDVDPMFENEFMERFVQGETYLNGTMRSLRSAQVVSFVHATTNRFTFLLIFVCVYSRDGKSQHRPCRSLSHKFGLPCHGGKCERLLRRHWFSKDRFAEFYQCIRHGDSRQ